jgi:MFS family permease
MQDTKQYGTTAVVAGTFLTPYRTRAAVQDLQADLQATSLATAATLAVYLFALGVSALLWGPVCDRIGRRPTYVASTVAFVAASLGCAFANSIWLLLLLRAVQGASSEWHRVQRGYCESASEPA